MESINQGNQLERWLNKRALLNHDILCNQIRNEIDALRRAPSENSTTRLRMWIYRESEYQKLLNECIVALSPMQLLESELFSCWPRELKESFSPIFHELFLIMTGLEMRIAELLQVLSASIASVKAFLSIEQSMRTLDDVMQIREKLANLSEGISSLPSKIGG